MPTCDKQDSIIQNNTRLTRRHVLLESIQKTEIVHLGPGASGWSINLNLNNFALNDLRLLPYSHANALAERLLNNSGESDQTNNVKMGIFFRIYHLGQCLSLAHFQREYLRTSHRCERCVITQCLKKNTPSRLLFYNSAHLHGISHNAVPERHPWQSQFSPCLVFLQSTLRAQQSYLK